MKHTCLNSFKYMTNHTWNNNHNITILKLSFIWQEHMQSNWSCSWMWYQQWTIFYFNQAVPLVYYHTSKGVWNYRSPPNPPKKNSTSEFKTHATRQAMYVQHFTLARSNLRILDFCQIVIPFHPDGVTLSGGVHKCTYLSRNVTAVITVLYLF